MELKLSPEEMLRTAHGVLIQIRVEEAVMVSVDGIVW